MSDQNQVDFMVIKLAKEGETHDRVIQDKEG
jgi:hypothetical protein